MPNGLLLTPALRVYFATITVTYPAGSTLTCTNGDYELVAETASGSYTFIVPYAGTWTIKSENGALNASSTVSVSEYNQSLTLTLNYRKYLYTTGGKDSGNWAGAGYGNVTINNTTIKCESNAGYGGNNLAKAYYKSKVDLTNYTKLCADVKTSKVVSGGRQVGVFSEKPGIYTTPTTHASATSTSRQTVSVNITNIKESRYVGVYAGSLETLTLYNLWIE